MRTPYTTLPQIAGLAYLGIIVLGLGAEVGLRMPVTTADDPAAMLATRLPQWRVALAADVIMATLDIGLALILYRLFRRFGHDLALTALVLRLVQMAIIAAHLPLLISAIQAPDPTELIERHALGYDLGLWFFGLNALIMAMLLQRAGIRWLAGLIAMAGIVYLTGSLTRFVAPDVNALVQPAYLVPVIAELSFALWLLLSSAARRIAAEV